MLSDLFHHRNGQQNHHEINAPTALLTQGLHAITNVTEMIAQLIPQQFASDDYETESESDATEDEAVEDGEEEADEEEGGEENESEEEEDDEHGTEEEELVTEEEEEELAIGLRDESLLGMDAIFWL